MRFLKQLVLDTAKVLAGLLVLVALVAGIAVAGVFSYLHEGEPQTTMAQHISTDAEAATPAVRVVEASKPAEPKPLPPQEQAAPPPVKVDTHLDATDDVRAMFPDGFYLMETTGEHKPKTCDDLKDAVIWVRVRDRIRSEMERYEISIARFLVGIATMGLSAFYGPNEPNRTIFAIKLDGKYLTFLLGAPRGDWDDDTVGPQLRLTYYALDKRRLGLVEAAAAEAPAFARPAKGVPKIKEIFRRCVYRGDGSDEF
jgi:hypothetical protein